MTRPHDRAAPRLPAIAVMPFVNASGDPDQDFLADGMAEEIITALSRVSGLFVIARNSSFAYRGHDVNVRCIGAELGVGYALEGSVRRGLDRLRVTGRLVNAVSGATLWSDRFEGDPGKTFELQDRVAACVAAAIEPTLKGAEIRRLGPDRPQPDTYDLLLRAYALIAEFTEPGITAALARLEEAIAREPGFAPALAAAAYCRALCHSRAGGGRIEPSAPRPWRGPGTRSRSRERRPDPLDGGLRGLEHGGHRSRARPQPVPPLAPGEPELGHGAHPWPVGSKPCAAIISRPGHARPRPAA